MTTTPGSTEPPLHERVAALTSELSTSERRVAEYMAENPAEVVAASAIELGRRTSTSDATVVRTTKALGYAGLKELKRELLGALTRQRDLAATLDDRLDRLPGAESHYARVLDDTVGLLEHMRRRLRSQDWDRAVDVLRSAERVLAFGLGPAGLLAEHLSLNLTRIGVDAVSSTLAGFRAADALVNLRPGDAVVVFAPIRQFRETGVVLDHAERVGARTVLVTESLGTALAGRVHVALTTPQSTISTASELVGGLVISHALVLALAAHSRAAAVERMELVNRLRAELVGSSLDILPLASPGGGGAV
ncbi:MurR/RpiR family transcriptional regulator [Marinitenerispora sediminis]|uniref:MurR/RpiR family transcriptional regulator n=1 Tax=Marinitenerispora sediminis TaxID=1931232 RepID=A0A368T4Z5_9ACTN|nr:MurR/RpiR family transcriptional regulator [Marinitenerispora sediminis]RCV57597.1 MurR/RpiR family transcriptional regulator [Marinitenerispora sediminis]RCV58312.1 MurR/RpiR family transcriptional regulator [Marinitenerispora sediminis]RCV59656.1 MurR/RpiR family transcriptional regulator [Marinitenerispora sediminis]